MPKTTSEAAETVTAAVDEPSINADNNADNAESSTEQDIPTDVDQDEPIAKSSIDPAAIEVVAELREHGFEAYLVGGCVRDLLLGLVPKDFDVATNATPEEVRGVFRRSRMIGRRFRIVHVRVGRALFEVSTYRKYIDEDDIEDDATITSDEGVILRDNNYGNLEDDTFRRDFTVNAMYYNPLDGTLLDKAGGQEDLAAKCLRLIGEPRLRLREDPVRILRAVRFAAKLDFHIDEAVQEAIAPTAELLTAIPPARLFDEMNKLFLAGCAERAWELLCEHELSPILFPATDPDDGLVKLAMASTDKRIADDKPVTPGFLFAVLLWDDFQARITENALHQSMQEAETSAAHECIREQQLTIAIPKRFAQFIRDVWTLQPRLERRQRKNLSRMLSHPKFRAAYDFLLLRAEMQLVDQEVADWWTEIQLTHPVTPRQEHAHGDDDEGSERGDSERKSSRSRGRRRPRRNNSDGNSSGNNSGTKADGNNATAKADGNRAANNSEEAPKKPKRRRRRRRPRKRNGEASNNPNGNNTGGNTSDGNTAAGAGGDAGKTPPDSVA